MVEQRNADLLREIGVGARLEREGIVHDGIHLQFEGERHRMPFRELTGRSIVIYGQTEIVKDLIAARARSGLPLFFEADDVAVHDLVAERPRITFVHEGRRHEIECDVLAGCDGFHGICRPAVPAGVLSTFEREYPFAWLGILADIEPSVDELVYAHHERGFALLCCARRSSRATTSRSPTTRTSERGPTTASGRSSRSGPRSKAGRCERGPCSRRGSPA